MYAVETLSEPLPAPVPGFDDFYESQYRALTRLALALTGSRAAAEDLVQETMLRAYKHWNRVADYERPGAWARRVLINLATSRGRRLTREARALVRLRGRPADAQLAPNDEEVWKTVRSLPRREAQVIALFYLEDMNVAEIARVLDAPEGTVKSLLHRARKELAEKLGEEDV